RLLHLLVLDRGLVGRILCVDVKVGALGRLEEDDYVLDLAVLDTPGLLLLLGLAPLQALVLVLVLVDQGEQFIILPLEFSELLIWGGRALERGPAFCFQLLGLRHGSLAGTAVIRIAGRSRGAATADCQGEQRRGRRQLESHV